MFREAVPEPVWKLLLVLSALNTAKRLYLAGGTALALQLGHRTSADLDFFTREDEICPAFLEDIRALGMNTTVVGRTPNHLELIIETIKVDCLREFIALVFPLKTIAHEMGGFQIADLRDIGRMKLHSIASRGGKKDYFDLYCLTRTAVPLEELLDFVVEKQGTIRFSRLLFLKGLIDFEEAEREAPPIMLWNIGWEEVKAGLTEEVKIIGRKWA
jgi:predicted nucleotidyltransferase component of viral defense system